MPHKMIEEIREQPEILRKIITLYLLDAKLRMFSLDAHKRKYQNFEKIILLGCGSSSHASFVGKYFAEELYGMECLVEFADEFISRKAVLNDNAIVIALSQSGKSKDTIKGVVKAKKAGIFTLSLTNSLPSPLSKQSDVAFNIMAGEEKAMAATKSFTAQLTLLYLVICKLLEREKGVNFKKMIDEFIVLPEKIEMVLKKEQEIKRIAKKIYEKPSMVVLGSKFNYPIALEAAHKIKEVSYIHAEGYPTEEFRHGPRAIVSRGFPVFFIMPRDQVFKRNLEMLKEMKKEGARVFAVSTEKIPGVETVIIPKVHEAWQVIINVVVFQILAYHLALFKKINPDSPRHLRKFIS